jgi:hypothetical protein
MSKKSNIFEFLKKAVALRALKYCPLFCLRDIITSKYLDGTGFESPYKQEIFFLLQNVQTGGAHTAPWSMGTGVRFLRQNGWSVKLNHSLPCGGAEVQNGWSCISAPPVCLYGVYSDNITSIYWYITIAWQLQKKFFLPKIIPKSIGDGMNAQRLPIVMPNPMAIGLSFSSTHLQQTASCYRYF